MTKSHSYLIAVVFLFLPLSWTLAQEDDEGLSDKNYTKLNFYDFRGTNVLDIGVGPSVLIGDYDNKEFGFYYRIGYKRAITPNILLGLSANGYNLSYNNTDRSLLSFDFNFEYLILPYEYFSPYVYGGFGINTSGDVDANGVKSQVGVGLEYIVTNQLGIKLFYEYNYAFEDDTAFLIADQDNDKFMRIGVGVNYYFGGSKEKAKLYDEVDTIINSNLLDSNNK